MFQERGEILLIGFHRRVPGFRRFGGSGGGKRRVGFIPRFGRSGYRRSGGRLAARRRWGGRLPAGRSFVPTEGLRLFRRGCLRLFRRGCLRLGGGWAGARRRIQRGKERRRRKRIVHRGIRGPSLHTGPQFGGKRIHRDAFSPIPFDELIDRLQKFLPRQALMPLQSALLPETRPFIGRGNHVTIGRRRSIHDCSAGVRRSIPPEARVRRSIPPEARVRRSIPPEAGVHSFPSSSRSRVKRPRRRQRALIHPDAYSTGRLFNQTMCRAGRGTPERTRMPSHAGMASAPPRRRADALVHAGVHGSTAIPPDPGRFPSQKKRNRLGAKRDGP